MLEAIWRKIGIGFFSRPLIWETIIYTTYLLKYKAGCFLSNTNKKNLITKQIIILDVGHF